MIEAQTWGVKAMDQVVGATAVQLDSRFASIRTQDPLALGPLFPPQETNIGNFVTDVMRHAMKA